MNYLFTSQVVELLPYLISITKIINFSKSQKNYSFSFFIIKELICFYVRVIQLRNVDNDRLKKQAFLSLFSRFLHKIFTFGNKNNIFILYFPHLIRFFVTLYSQWDGTLQIRSHSSMDRTSLS